MTAAWSESAATGKPFHVRSRLRMKDGNYRYMRVRAVPQRDEEGRVLRWYGVTEDVHEQEQAEIAQRDVEERYRLAAQATNDAVWDHDFIAGTIEWGDNAAAIFGCSKSPVGRTPASWWADRIHPDEKLSLRAEPGGRDPRHGDALVGDLPLPPRRRQLCRRARPRLHHPRRGRAGDPRGRGDVGPHRAPPRRGRNPAHAGGADPRLAALARWARWPRPSPTSSTSRSTALSNFISGTKRIADNPETCRARSWSSALDGAEAAALRAGEILRRLRELVSRGKVSVQPEHLPQLIDEACVLAFVDEHALGVSHRLELDPDAAWVRADRIQIQQVLINLVRNAVEAMSGSARGARW